MRFPDATNDEPDTDPDEEQRPGKLDEAAVEDIKLPQQEENTESDQDDSADRLFATPEERLDDVGPLGRDTWIGGIRIDRVSGARYRRVSGGRRRVRRLIRRLIWALAGWLVRSACVGRLVGSRRRRVSAGARRRLASWGHTWILSRMLRTAAEVQPVAHFVQTERIGQRVAVTQCSCRVVGLKGLVENPCADEDSEDPVILRNAYQHGEDDHVDEALEELAVVHCAHARNEAEDGGGRGVGRTRNSRNKRLLIGLPCVHAWFAENLSSRRGADARAAKRLAAVLAKGSGSHTTVIYAVHVVLLSRTSLSELPDGVCRAGYTGE